MLVLFSKRTLVHQAYSVFKLRSYRYRLLSSIPSPKPVIEAQPTVKKPRPFNEIPRHRGLPVFGNFFEFLNKEYRLKPWLIWNKRESQYGKIWVEKMLPNFPAAVFITDPKDVEQIYRADGKIPVKMDLPPWVDSRKALNREPALSLSSGDKWLAQRQPMSKYLLTLPSVNRVSPEFNDIALEFCSYLRENREANNLVSDLMNHTAKWSFEGVNVFVLNHRLGLLASAEIPPNMQQIFDAVRNFLDLSFKLLLNPPVYKIYPTKQWKEFLKDTDTIFTLAEAIIHKRIKEINANPPSTEDRPDFLTYMIQSSNLSEKMVVSNAVDLILAGIDTTSTTFTFALALLAENPEIQSKLREDVKRVVGDSRDISPSHIHDLPLLRHCIKETMRLFPIAASNTRFLSEDTVLSGYAVPSGTLVMIPIYHTGHKEELVEDAEVFNPYRWNRETGVINKFTSLPFSFGARMCIGKRVAELDMHTTLAQLIRHFVIKLPTNAFSKVQAVQRLFLCPENSVDLLFEDAVLSK